MSGAISATTLGIVAGVGAAGSIGGALISSNAAGNAADAQSSAANHAADLQYKASQDALAFQKEQYNQGQQNLAPWLQSGKGALSNLDFLMGISSPTQGGFPGAQPQPGQGGQPPAFGSGPMQPVQGPGRPMPPSGAQPGYTGHTPPISSLQGAFNGRGNPVLPTHGPVPVATGHTAPISSLGSSPGQPGASNPGGAFGSLMQPFQGQFTAPTGLTEQNDPGFQARLKLGTDTMERSAAARGSVLTGGVAQAENQAAQDYASNEYGNVYNRAFNQYAQQYNQFEQGQQNQYNRLAGLSGLGQQTAQQLGYLGNQASQGVSQNLLSTAGMMGQDYQNAGAANASGYVGAANAWGGALGGMSSNLQNLLLLQQLQGGGGNPLTVGSNGSIISPGY